MTDWKQFLLGIGTAAFTIGFFCVLSSMGKWLYRFSQRHGGTIRAVISTVDGIVSGMKRAPWTIERDLRSTERTAAELARERRLLVDTTLRSMSDTRQRQVRNECRERGGCEVQDGLCGRCGRDYTNTWSNPEIQCSKCSAHVEAGICPACRWNGRMYVQPEDLQSVERDVVRRWCVMHGCNVEGHPHGLERERCTRCGETAAGLLCSMPNPITLGPITIRTAQEAIDHSHQLTALASAMGQHTQDRNTRRIDSYRGERPGIDAGAGTNEGRTVTPEEPVIPMTPVVEGGKREQVHMEEKQRQMIILALAELALSRPGWEYSLREIAKMFCGEDMYEGFKKTSADRVKATHADLRGVRAELLPDASIDPIELPEKS
jgi:hypothetical protein